MANHKSSVKRIRQTQKNRLHNRYYAKTARNAVRSLRATKEADAAATLLPQVAAMLDKLAKRNMIHKNKASNLKSKLAKHVNKLSK
jgi:small subunit ribosomal protein S20